MDLYGRMKAPEALMKLAIRRLTSYRLVRSGLGCLPQRVKALESLAGEKPMDYNAIVYNVEHLFT